MDFRKQLISRWRALHTRQTICRAFEVVVARIVPGAISLLVLFLLAAWLPRDTYGVASTQMATISTIATFLYGPILLPALVQHAERSERDGQRHFEFSQATKALTLSGLVLTAGLGLSFAFDWRIAAGIGAFGSYTVVLQILRSRLEFIKFSIGSTIQSISFLLLTLLLVKPEPTVQRVIESFAISYLIGLCATAVLVSFRFVRIRWSDIRESFRLGSAPTLSNLIEAFFTLGLRYLLFGVDRGLLGVVSFSLDLAQRTVAIFINIATFGIVPYALKVNDTAKLWRTLQRGAAIAALVAVFSLAAILTLGWTGTISALTSAVYDPLSFAIIALAVTIHRIGKMILTPVAIRMRHPKLVLIPVAIISPIALSVLATGWLWNIPYAVEAVYFAALISWTVWGYFLLRKQLVSL